VGLNKTITTSMVIGELLERIRISNVLIVVSKAMIHRWIREFKEKYALKFTEITRNNLSIFLSL